MATTLEPTETADGLTYVLATRRADSGLYECGCSCAWSTRDWPRRNIAEERLAQHAEEHRTGVPMEELIDFLRRHDMSTPARALDPFAGFPATEET